MEEKEAREKATISDGMEPFSMKWKMNAKAYLILGFVALSAHLFVTFAVSYIFNRQVYSLVFSYLMSSAVNMQIPDVDRGYDFKCYFKSIGFSLLLLPVTIYAV